MPSEIIIVGGFLDLPSSFKQVFLDRLKKEVSSDVEWAWISCDAQSQFGVPSSVINKLGEKLTVFQKDKKKPAGVQKEIRIIKLACLHGRTENLLYRHWKEPVLPPSEVRTSQQFIDWILANSNEVLPRVAAAPTTVKEAKTIAAERFVNDLIFGDDVDQGISDIFEQAGPPDKVFVFLEKLAKLAKERRDGILNVPPLQWLENEGVVGSGESESIKNNAAKMKRRTWDFGDGGTFAFELHLKPNEGTSPDRCVRIYFAWCEKRKKIVIGWIGRHPV